jgi:hypothetical protein
MTDFPDPPASESFVDGADLRRQLVRRGLLIPADERPPTADRRLEVPCLRLAHDARERRAIGRALASGPSRREFRPEEPR